MATTTISNDYILGNILPDKNITGIETTSVYTRLIRQPFVLYNRFTTKEELEKYVQISDKNSGNAYDGQIVSVYNDTDEKNGIYYISGLKRDTTEDGNVIDYQLTKVSGGGGIGDLDIATTTDIESIFDDTTTPENP